MSKVHNSFTTAKLTKARVIWATRRVLISLVMPASVTMTIARPTRGWDEGHCGGRKPFRYNAGRASLTMWGPEMLLVIVHHLGTSALEINIQWNSHKYKQLFMLYCFRQI